MEIVNSCQGCQHTSAVWTHYLKEEEIKIFIYGKDRALDNVWIDRFWKLVKHDCIYLNPADDGFEDYEGVQNHLAYYHQKNYHTTK